MAFSYSWRDLAFYALVMLVWLGGAVIAAPVVLVLLALFGAAVCEGVAVIHYHLGLVPTLLILCLTVFIESSSRTRRRVSQIVVACVLATGIIALAVCTVDNPHMWVEFWQSARAGYYAR